jgi:SAM-dependent methyltransferase
MSDHPHSQVASHPSPAVEHQYQRRGIWESKYAIRACYQGWLQRMKPFLAPGPSLEIGAGSCELRQLWPEILETDIVPTPWVDFASDALRLPLADASVGNIILIDLLHHLTDPHSFLDAAARVLRPGGRIVAIEPYITPLSYLCYKMAHDEDVWFKSYQKPSERKDPWQGNLAMANLIFGRELPDWSRRHPSLPIVHREVFGMLDFQLAGGFKPYALVGRRWMYDLALRLDRVLDPLAALLGFRIFVVIENRPAD